jgi:hypothetical protein
MKTFLCLLLLSIGALPLAAQVDRMVPARALPPEIVSTDELPRNIVRVGALHVRVDFENERTRVLRLTMGAGDTIPSHDDRAGVLVCLAGCRLRFTLPDGKSQDVELKAGETRWMPEERRVLRNLGARAVEVLYIETKRT